MNYLALLTVALAIAMPAVEATKCIPTIPKGAGKKTTCTALSKGGLVNLAALGCADVDISPSIDILRRNADARRSLEIVEQRSSQDFCKALSLGGLINLSLLGCTDVTVSPDIDVLRRTVSDKESICKALSLGGLINVALLGCADVDISPDVDILRKRNALCARFADNGLHARGLGCEGSHLEARAAEVDMERRWSKCSAFSKAGLLNLSLLGCGDVDVSPDVDILKRGECYNPPKTTKKHHTKTKTRTHKPTHKPTTRRPQPTTTRTRKTHQPTHTPRPQPPACAVNVKETCESMSSAGLINLDVLGCANVKVAPTIKVGQALLPAVTNIVGTVGGTVDNLVDNLVGDVLGGLLGGKRN